MALLSAALPKGKSWAPSFSLTFYQCGETTAMGSLGFKFFALLALLVLGEACANSGSPRDLRIEQPGDNVELPPTRHLQGKMGWWAVIKTSLAHQPIGDKVFYQLKQVKERYLDKAK
ncbi:unnamed protein product [Phytophthora fragariaefolia]|uniref:Unnamed protein product n=1 Tax=Phytophthora fragariaefolia TaxID=1490495 RepID=A0A9W7DAF8_9STRA|nr:unnamed protein product [Phytophthora fragariaefolia]